MRKKSGLALRVCLETGLRIGDVLKMRPDDISGRILSYTAEKTGKAGKKKLSGDLVRELRSISGQKWVFEGRSGSKTGHLTRQAVYLDLKRVSKKLGMQGQISPHTARKTYAVEEFHKHGLDFVKQELQHSNDAVTLLYALSDVVTAPAAGGQGVDLGEKLRELTIICQNIQQLVLEILAKM